MTTTSDARVMLVIVEHGSRDKVSDVDMDFSLSREPLPFKIFHPHIFHG
tara:strand:+ start:210 stop:356 length:147 start_codon:yes stop_codon:yes gene_type:complete